MPKNINLYTQFQRFVATLLLFSILLQSCGNPNWKMLEPADAGSSGETSKPKRLAPLQPIKKQEDASEGAMKVGSAPTIARSSEALAVVASEADYVPPAAPSRTAHSSSQLGSSSPTAVRSLVVPASKTAQAARPSSVLKKPPIHGASKPQRAVPDKAPASPHALHSNQLVGATSPPTSVKPSDRTTPLSRPLQRAAHPLQTATKSSVTAQQTPTHAAPKTQLYPSAQGHQVCFEAQSGVWQAQVTNVWGCTQKLPVVCAPDQAPERAIQQLASQVPGQHKYCIHILETDQPPWASRVVYVGALGLRGGGNVVSAVEDVARGVAKVGRFAWGVVSAPVTGIIYAFKDNIPRLPCHVATLSKYDEDDLPDSEVDNCIKVGSKWVTFYKGASGYWYAHTSRFKYNHTIVGDLCYDYKPDTIDVPVKSRRSVSRSLEDLVSSQFSWRKYREKSLHGASQFMFHDYNDYDGMGRELELITSPEQVQTSKQNRRRQRRENRRKQEEERRRQEEERRRQEEERRRQEEERRRQEERDALVKTVSEAAVAKLYDALDQNDSLAEAHTAQRHAMVQSLARELVQGPSRVLEYEVIADGYLSDEELDCDLTENKGTGLDFGTTTDRLPYVGSKEEAGTEEKKEEAPLTPDDLFERLAHKQKCAQTFDKQERHLQRSFHQLLQSASSYLANWQSMASEDDADPAMQAHLQDWHEDILALPEALTAWEQSLQSWGKALDDWANSLHPPADASWNVDLDLGDYHDMLEHYQKAQETRRHTQDEYQVLLQEVATAFNTPQYHTALTTLQLQRQARSLAHTLVQIANKAAVATEQTLQQVE